ncbi:hypothetical protein RIF29_38370 [Crotalaria pallida]|uniref:Uncharacterized protein n=1 Tax=Crotalaria pallida TaxID=3830 RepID=A0AAN9E1L4_CROPI
MTIGSTRVFVNVTKYSREDREDSRVMKREPGIKKSSYNTRVVLSYAQAVGQKRIIQRNEGGGKEQIAKDDPDWKGMRVRLNPSEWEWLNGCYVGKIRDEEMAEIIQASMREEELCSEWIPDSLEGEATFMGVDTEREEDKETNRNSPQKVIAINHEHVRNEKEFGEKCHRSKGSNGESNFELEEVNGKQVGSENNNDKGIESGDCNIGLIGPIMTITNSHINEDDRFLSNGLDGGKSSPMPLAQKGDGATEVGKENSEVSSNIDSKIEKSKREKEKGVEEQTRIEDDVSQETSGGGISQRMGRKKKKPHKSKKILKKMKKKELVAWKDFWIDLGIEADANPVQEHRRIRIKSPSAARLEDVDRCKIITKAGFNKENQSKSTTTSGFKEREQSTAQIGIGEPQRMATNLQLDEEKEQQQKTINSEIKSSGSISVPSNHIML